ncbi:hypothetical protein PENTCL1PPCAC_29512, partial [Pristionchus entomophagus]
SDIMESAEFACLPINIIVRGIATTLHKTIELIRGDTDVSEEMTSKQETVVPSVDEASSNNVEKSTQGHYFFERMMQNSIYFSGSKGSDSDEDEMDDNIRANYAPTPSTPVLMEEQNDTDSNMEEEGEERLLAYGCQ